jgi:Pvc16 N-terminal domain
MSNALAIGAVTAIFKNILENTLARPIAASILNQNNNSADKVTVLLPNMTPLNGGNDFDRLNLFLYQTSLNTNWRNVGMPSHNSDGDLVNTPPLALDLHYLLTAYSKQSFHAEVLLGFAMQLFHENPILPRDKIRSVLNTFATGSDQTLRALATSELADQIEQIKITPQPMNIEEISKLWAAMQSQYQPTMAYHVSVVLIEQARSVKRALPVRQRQLVAVPQRSIVLTEVQPQIVTADSPLTVQGENLTADQTQVLISGTVVTPTLLNAREFQVTVPTNLEAGIQTLQVKHLIDFGEPSGLRRGFESNVLPFVLRPRIVGSVTATGTVAAGNVQIALTLAPALGSTQKVVLLLNQQGGAMAFSAIAEKRTATVTQITIPVKTVQPGTYFVRVQVDGAESLLEYTLVNPVNPTGAQQVTPTVVIN